MNENPFIKLYVTYGFMTRSKYTNVALPEDLIEKLDRVIRKSKLGYTSRAEIVKEAVRVFLAKLQETN